MAGHRARSLDDRQRAEGRRMSHHSRTPTTESACAEPFTRWRRRSLAVGAKQRYARWRHRDGESRATATRRDNARMHEHLKEDYGVLRLQRTSGRMGGGEGEEPRRPCRRFVHIRSSPAVISAVILANNNIITIF